MPPSTLRRFAILLTLIASLSLTACPEAIDCGTFLVPRDGMCSCPDGTMFVPSERACRLPDGGLVDIDDGGTPDAALDDASADDGGRDSGIDACAERTFYRDVDGDGFGSPDETAEACDAPTGYVELGTDCDDACAHCTPDGTEVCDTEDNDCDGSIDEGVLLTFYRDADTDGFGDPRAPMSACAMPDGHVTNDDDCDDDCAACIPGGTEVCDGVLDQDCDGAPDDGCACTIGTMRGCPGGSDVGECVAGVQTCSGAGEWGTCTGAVGAAAEVCDGLDSDCDGAPDGPAASAACGPRPRATSVLCTGGSCVIAGCTTGWGNCDADPTDGCEAELAVDEAHCGDCSVSCGWYCSSASCDDAVDVQAGSDFACAVHESGTVSCWGNNTSGQLGSGTSGDRRESPTRVLAPSGAGLLTGVVEVATGRRHTCARTTAGTVYCWGDNSSGQLGDSSTTRRTRPVAVTGLSGVSGVTAGSSHTCALIGSDGAVRCWGSNVFGQVGDGTMMERRAPTPVTGLSGVRRLSAGSNHTCVVQTGGSARCWGEGALGKLGDGSSMNRPSPVLVSGISGATDVAAGVDHTCAIVSGGGARCWGSGGSGRLGNGGSTASSTPVVVMGVTGATLLGLGNDHTCARLSTGGVRCWGENGAGQVGDGATTDRDVGTEVAGLSSAVEVDGGQGFTCAFLTDGAIRCWGRNSTGQLGTGSLSSSYVPVPVGAPE